MSLWLLPLAGDCRCRQFKSLCPDVCLADAVWAQCLCVAENDCFCGSTHFIRIIVVIKILIIIIIISLASIRVVVTFELIIPILTSSIP